MDRVPDGRLKCSLNPRVVVVDSSDSDSEGFAEDLTPVHSKSNGKASSKSLKTVGKASSFYKEDSSKGKAYSGDKDGKGSASNAVPTKSDAELMQELDNPPKCQMLMSCEIHEYLAILSEYHKIKILESFDKAFQYAKDANHFTNSNSAKEALESLKKCGVHDDEICMIANLGPKTDEEIYALAPSLKAANISLTEGPIAEVVSVLANIKAVD